MARHVLISVPDASKSVVSLADDATLTASHETGSLVRGNLLTAGLTEIWRPNAVTGVYLVIDLGAAYAVAIIALINTNLTSAATWQIRGATSEANLTAAPGYDSGSVTAWPAGAGVAIRGYVDPVHIPSAAQSYRWWRIDLTDAANPDGYLQAGRLVMTKAVEPARNFDRGRGVYIVDPSVIRRTRGGQGAARSETIRRGLEFGLSGLSKAEALGSLFDLEWLAGSTREIAVCLEPDDPDYHHLHFIWGRLVALEPFEDPKHNAWIKRYRIEQSL